MVRAVRTRTPRWYRVRDPQQLGRALTSCRKARQLTQADLAELLGVDRTTVLNLEAGRPHALDRMLRAFAQLGFDVIVVPRDVDVAVTMPRPTDPRN